MKTKVFYPWSQCNIEYWKNKNKNKIRIIGSNVKDYTVNNRKYNNEKQITYYYEELNE